MWACVNSVFKRSLKRSKFIPFDFYDDIQKANYWTNRSHIILSAHDLINHEVLTGSRSNNYTLITEYTEKAGYHIYQLRLLR